MHSKPSYYNPILCCYSFIVIHKVIFIKKHPLIILLLDIFGWHLFMYSKRKTTNCYISSMWYLFYFFLRRIMWILYSESLQNPPNSFKCPTLLIFLNMNVKNEGQNIMLDLVIHIALIPSRKVYKNYYDSD